MRMSPRPHFCNKREEAMTHCWSISSHEEEMLNNQKRHNLSQQEKCHNPFLGIEKDRIFLKSRTQNTNSFGPKVNHCEEQLNQVFPEGPTFYVQMMLITSRIFEFFSLLLPLPPPPPPLPLFLLPLLLPSSSSSHSPPIPSSLPSFIYLSVIYIFNLI